MATNLKELLDSRIKPPPSKGLTDVAGNIANDAYKGFMGLFGAALAAIPIPTPEAAQAGLQSAAADALAPIDPSKALRDIAAAVSEAEKVFNTQNLAVVNGKVNVQLMVKVGDIAGAQAVFDLVIAPAPQK